MENNNLLIASIQPATRLSFMGTLTNDALLTTGLYSSFH
jgi:hypothetical protein